MSETPYEAGPLWLCQADELDEIAEGRARGFDPRQIGQDSVFVVRHAGRLHAWRNACPHIDGAPMAWRKDAYTNAAGTHIVCSAHGAQFEPATGHCVRGPCLGQSLTAIEMDIRSDGSVWLRTH
ncbi:Rieske (2Fe-2S) protein [Ideonella sp. 4Y11]|uniref:Rieske (2Fe-2S) protein n=1 Tax=Ideonella aquatica TaxID=2824119 RepID=A0A941BEK1_9BURK|nr:Rieske (2Fe-2S) protein [Ideonella aquatica]MBQ0957806.1 Rieske (2Fe-2S) protein [Ideonella aquatica]